MIVTELFTAAKSGRQDDCEDGIVVTGDFAAVIDGGTDKTGRRYGTMTGGRYAMLACADAIRRLDPGTELVEGLRCLTAALAARLEPDLVPSDRPEAVVTIFSRARREVWQVGDVGFWHVGLPTGGLRPTKTVDRYAMDIRAAIIRVEIAARTNPSELARNDPGRHAILELLIRQAYFRNNRAAGEWAYPAIDGRAVPTELVTVHQIPADVTELVIASDGYPRLLPTLDASEELLARLLAKDPLCIAELRGTKGVEPGNQSFDDRAYLKIAL